VKNILEQKNNIEEAIRQQIVALMVINKGLHFDWIMGVPVDRH
jgi:hypothetical protein